MISVLEYTDFRLFLRDYIEDRQVVMPSWSFRFVASKLECDPGFFNRVLKGERTLTPEYRTRLVKLLALSGRDKEYFELLVQFNQAKKEMERDELYSRLKLYRRARIAQVSRDEYGMYDEWYTIVLRELLNVCPIYDISPESCRQLASKLNPPLQPSTIIHSLETLRELGMIVPDDSGRLTLKDRIISTGTNIPPDIVRRVLRQFFQLGTSSLERFPPDKRVCAALTVSVSKKGYEEIKSKLEQTRREILEIVRTDSDVNSVYNINFQLFPVSSEVSV